MKELWTIVLEKLKLVQPIEALVAVGIVGMFTIGMLTIVTSKFIFMIIQVTAMLSGHPAG
jgi:hypothetical protein